MEAELNLANSLFQGFNDARGIVICGYEWGFSLEDQRLFADGNEVHFDSSAITTFSYKVPAHGARALSWRYDRRIVRWFELWGHPLDRVGLGGNFEKCLVQTNWCSTEGHRITENYYQKLSQKEQVENFIFHVRALDPSLIIFMGSTMIDVLQNNLVMRRFTDIAGSQTIALKKMQKDFSGRRFKVGFQSFERCELVSLPHPSSSRGLSDSYIELFKNEVGGLIANFKLAKGID